jgi:F-type H+-transporting ATPase subunit b
VETEVAAILTVVAQAEANDPADLYPHWNELIVGAIAFAILFFFMWKWVLPRLNAILEERRERIRGELERAEQSRSAAERELAEYRSQLADAQEQSTRIIEEARRTAEQLRADLQSKAEQEAQSTVLRAQEEIRAERDRVFQELRAQIADMAVELAGRVVGASLDRAAHERLIDAYIAEVAGSGRSNGEAGAG